MAGIMLAAGTSSTLSTKRKGSAPLSALDYFSVPSQIHHSTHTWHQLLARSALYLSRNYSVLIMQNLDFQNHSVIDHVWAHFCQIVGSRSCEDRGEASGGTPRASFFGLLIDE